MLFPICNICFTVVKILIYLNIKNLNTKQTFLFNYIFKSDKKNVIAVYDPNNTDITLQKEIQKIIRE